MPQATGKIQARCFPMPCRDPRDDVPLLLGQTLLLSSHPEAVGTGSMQPWCHFGIETVVGDTTFSISFDVLQKT
jgi:hypothetical protein